MKSERPADLRGALRRCAASLASHCNEGINYKFTVLDNCGFLAGFRDRINCVARLPPYGLVMVTVLRTPARPMLVRPATCTHGVCNEESYFAFREGRVGCYRDRIRSDCSGHCPRDHRDRERPGQQP